MSKDKYRVLGNLMDSRQYYYKLFFLDILVVSNCLAK